MMDRRDIFEAAHLEPLLDLFSAVMVFNRELEIVFASDTLNRYIPSLAKKPTLFEAFHVVRPASASTFDDIELNRKSLFLLRATDDSFAVRGQVVNGSSELGDFMVFCGAPWLAWMSSNRPETKLGLKDFTSQDSQIDQLFYMETESRMIADLEGLNAELQQAKKKLESAEVARTAFFAQMSHEMRTPLNGVVSALSLLEEHNLGNKASELRDLASKSSDNLMQVINYVLDVSKLDSSNFEPTAASFDLQDLIHSVTDIVRARALEKHLALHSHVQESLATRYTGDAPRLRQVLLNLLINAIKFTERGAVSITVGPADASANTIRIEVVDTGVGIAPDAQTQIFEPFVTLASNSTAASMEGTGLGLDIVRRNIDAMDGEMGVNSSPGVGSTFWIELPLEEDEATTQRTETEQDKHAEDNKFSGTVLLVDDNETNLLLGSMILEGMGVSVLEANGGEIAVAIALQEQVDLVLMDISMPGMDGYEATRLIRKERSADALPVIALTAYASSEEREKSTAVGMNDYLTKPIERDRLAQVLSNYLERRRAHGEVAGEDQTADEDLLDLTVIESMLEQIGSDNLKMVIDKFCTEAGDRWQALENASSSSDLAREAHTLASTCRSFGLPPVAEKLQVIEAAAKVGKTVEALEDTAPIGAMLEQSLNALRVGVNSLGTEE